MISPLFAGFERNQTRKINKNDQQRERGKTTDDNCRTKTNERESKRETERDRMKNVVYDLVYNTDHNNCSLSV